MLMTVRVEYRSGRHVDLLHKLETLYRASENLKYASDKLHGTRHSGLGYCCKYARLAWDLGLGLAFRFSLFAFPLALDSFSNNSKRSKHLGEVLLALFSLVSDMFLQCTSISDPEL